MRSDAIYRRAMFSLRRRILLLAVCAALPAQVHAQPLGPKSALEIHLESQAPQVNQALRPSGRIRPRSRAEAEALSAALAARGCLRLDDPQLLEFFALRSALAESADEIFCARLWTGGFPRGMLPGLVLYLS